MARGRIAPVLLLVAAIGAAVVSAQSLSLPNKAGSLKFAAMGDNGTGEPPQYEI